MKRIAMATTLAIALSGCSWAFQDTLPDIHKPGDAPMCSKGKGWPIVDTVFMVSNLLAMAVYLDAEYGGAAAVQGGFAALWGASAYSGFKNAGECKQAYFDYVRKERERNER
ncbi:MAG: hypothetical protein R3322_00380 [Kiloniellales bacterium]|nr:hypothetical protein [Kiloniellales bacterium]